MIVWINGVFGAGKTTLAEELHRRLPDALLRGDQHTPGELADLVLTTKASSVPAGHR